VAAKIDTGNAVQASTVATGNAVVQYNRACGRSIVDTVHIVRGRVCVMVRCPSVRLPVRLSVCLSQLSITAAPCDGFAAVAGLGGQEISIDCCTAGAQQQHGAQQHGDPQQMRAVSRLQPP